MPIKEKFVANLGNYELLSRLMQAHRAEGDLPSDGKDVRWMI
jgi:hypothetical protein